MGVGTGEDGSVDCLLDCLADAGEAMASHKHSRVRWEIWCLCCRRGHEVLDQIGRLREHGRWVEASCQGSAQVVIRDEHRMQVVRAFVMEGYVIDGDLSAYTNLSLERIAILDNQATDP